MYVLQGVSYTAQETNQRKQTELLDSAKDTLMNSVISIESSTDAERPIGFKACSFSWDSFSSSLSAGKKKQRHTRERFELRFDGEVTFKRGALNLIIGPTASGKVYHIKRSTSFGALTKLAQTSVLMALLGEMYYKPHGVGSWFSLPRDSRIAYAAQETWVLNETIRVRSRGLEPPLRVLTEHLRTIFCLVNHTTKFGTRKVGRRHPSLLSELLTVIKSCTSPL
jgi:hypothetical protein